MQLLSFTQNFTDFAVTLLARLPHKFLSTEGTTEHIIFTMFLLLMSLQTSFLFEELVTLRAVECGEERRMSFFHMQVQVSLKFEGLFTLVTLPHILLDDGMSIVNMSLHIFFPFKLFTTMTARMMFLAWPLEWVVHRDLVDLSHVPFEMLSG